MRPAGLTVGQVRAPALFVWGADDPIGGEAIARRLVNMLPNAELDVMPRSRPRPVDR